MQFASINQKIRTPEGTDLATDGMSLEPPLSQIWASVESDADPTSGGMIEFSARAVGEVGELNDTPTKCRVTAPAPKPEP